MSAITLDTQGNGPAGKITSAPSQVSLGGGAAPKKRVAPQRSMKHRNPRNAPSPVLFRGAIKLIELRAISPSPAPESKTVRCILTLPPGSRVFSLSSRRARRRLGRGGLWFSWVSPLPGPLPTPPSWGEGVGAIGGGDRMRQRTWQAAKFH